MPTAGSTATVVKTATFPTLPEATRAYRLRDPDMDNAQVAEYLDVLNGQGDFMGMPDCCFFRQGALAAIRTKKDELVIFHVYQSIQMRAAKIADRIMAIEPEETHS